MRAPKLVLLPGMDGTGELFSSFIQALDGRFPTQVVSYPRDRVLSYAELVDLVRSSISISEPFVVLAESFSTPLAIEWAARRPANLKGLILCAGFAVSPLRGWKRAAVAWSAQAAFKFRLPELIIRTLLVGSDASVQLVSEVRRAVSSVARDVLLARLRSVLDCDEQNKLHRIDVPILYIQAKDDRLIACAAAVLIQKLRPDVNVLPVKGPHLLLQRVPKKCADVVARFVEELP